MILTQANLESLRDTFDARFQKGVTGAPNVGDILVTEVPSTSAANVYSWLGALPGFKKWVGEFVYEAAEEHGYRLENDKFAVAMQIDLDKYEDDTIQTYATAVEGWGSKGGNLKDNNIFDALKNGHQKLCFTGKTFFATNHPATVKSDAGKTSKGTITNIVAPESNPAKSIYFVCLTQYIKPILYQNRKKPFFWMDTEKKKIEEQQHIKMHGIARNAAGYSLPQLAIKCTKPLTAEVWEEVRTLMESYVDEAGEPLGFTPTHVVFGTSNQAAVENLFKRKTINGTDNTAYNAVELVKSLRLP